MEKQLQNIEDAYKWSLATAQALRDGNLAAIDMDELIGEIESIASGLRRELLSTLRSIIEAMLVIECTNASEKEKSDSDRQLVHNQGQLRLLLHSAPSLRQILTEAAEESYSDVKGFVTEDYGVSLPEQCPIAFERIVEDPYERLLAEEKLA